MPLSKQTKDRIATVAIREYPANQYMSAELFFKRQGQQESYIAGAEAQAESAAGLVEALEQISDLAYVAGNAQIQNIALAAIKKYNQSK